MQAPFPMTFRFDEPRKPVKFYTSRTTISVACLDWPREGYAERCYKKIVSTWQDEPHQQMKSTPQETFRNLLNRKVLPNSLESLVFDFRIEGMTLIEITHLLRHRQMFGIHAQCTADRFLNVDSAFIPSSIYNSEYCEEYKRLTTETVHFYQDMVDSLEISIMDARYILPRNFRYYYYVSMNLSTAMAFIKQRRCTAIQPELDNIIAQKIYEHIILHIPEVAEVLDLKCDGSCHTTFNNDEHTTRLYQPDENHRKIMEDKGCNLAPENFVYSKTRKEMGAYYE